MSRHELRSVSDTEVVVGWDPPLRTFFAQAWDRSRDQDDPAAELLWIGCSPAEITDPQMVCDAVARWAEVPPSLVATLARDRDGAL